MVPRNIQSTTSHVSMAIRCREHDITCAHGDASAVIPSSVVSPTSLVSVLPGALNTVIAAVKAGELDSAMAAAVAAGKRKSGGR